MKEQTKVKRETTIFFENLIEKTGTYYLSDYVDNYGEFDSEIISPGAHSKIVKERDLLKNKCIAAGLDIHAISCEVADKFIN